MTAVIREALQKALTQERMTAMAVIRRLAGGAVEGTCYPDLKKISKVIEDTEQRCQEILDHLQKLPP